MPERILWVDTLRGFAILLMVIFHFCYDLRYFGYVDWQVPNGEYWWPLRYLILSLFIFTAGMSLSLAHVKRFSWLKFTWRTIQLLFTAVVVSIGSSVLFPQSWIYFGILHFIFFASCISVVLVSKPHLALLVGIIILVGYWLGWIDESWPLILIAQWLPNHTEDLVPLFPWLGVMLLGLGVAGVFPLNKVSLQHRPIHSYLNTMGRHGLLIYLIHQPVLFAGFILVS